MMLRPNSFVAILNSNAELRRTLSTTSQSCCSVSDSHILHHCRVVATCRNPDGATGLHDLASQHGERLSIVRLDATDEATIQVIANARSRAAKQRTQDLAADMQPHGGAHTQ